MKKSTLACILFFCFLIMLCCNLSNNFYVFASGKITEDTYTAKSLFLMDYNTNQILYEKNSLDKIPVASIVKLMTICLTCEKIDYGNINIDEKVIASEYASSMGGSQVFIESGGEYSIGDLLKSTIVSSANDASVALAEKIAGSENNFVKLMNKKALELGMKNTNYVNCTGLPASNQFSSAKDTAILLKEVFKYDTYHNYSKIWMDTLKHPKGRETELVNTNKLIRYYEGCDGGKTGSTNEAGYCLATTAKRGDMRLIAVVLGAENGKLRFAETSKLLNFGFNNFENKLIVSKDEILSSELKIQNSRQLRINFTPNKSLYVLSKKMQEDNVSTKVVIDKNVKAPIKVGDKVGIIYLIKNGEVISQTELISSENVVKTNLYDDVVKIVEIWNIKG
ncbi:MAG: D-alanyl-D-alanine carboxypeptidase [Clostridia bacterium]|nr:D-alanyl-D-alanine carboxypeptidase [Clostridia bacterium]